MGPRQAPGVTGEGLRRFLTVLDIKEKFHSFRSFRGHHATALQGIAAVELEKRFEQLKAWVKPLETDFETAGYQVRSCPDISRLPKDRNPQEKETVTYPISGGFCCSIFWGLLWSGGRLYFGWYLVILVGVFFRRWPVQRGKLRLGLRLGGAVSLLSEYRTIVRVRGFISQLMEVIKLSPLFYRIHL